MLRWMMSRMVFVYDRDNCIVMRFNKQLETRNDNQCIETSIVETTANTRHW